MVDISELAITLPFKVDVPDTYKLLFNDVSKPTYKLLFKFTWLLKRDLPTTYKLFWFDDVSNTQPLVSVNLIDASICPFFSISIPLLLELIPFLFNVIILSFTCKLSVVI